MLNVLDLVINHEMDVFNNLFQVFVLNKADDEFYKQSDLILKFCKNASKIFMEATPSEKRTICEIIGSNFIASGKNIDITLYPVFYDIIEMNRLGRSNY